MNHNTKPTVATNTEFTSRFGEVLLVANGSDAFHMIAGPTGPSLIFSHTDAPAIALAILKAAGVQAAPHDSASSVEIALNHLAEHVGIQRNNAALAELTHRRDKLAKQLTPLAVTYAAALPAIQNAIDMIIDLQNEATK